MNRYLACLIALLAWPGGNAAAAVQPNFLLIIADDLNWRDLGCTGNPDVQPRQPRSAESDAARQERRRARRSGNQSQQDP